LDDPDTLHLSALMCPAHRLDVINKIKHRLANGEECRVVSTQVVEAGVDLDFPCVMRAMGPLDRIVQAAGRCNREGRLDQLGEAIVFEPLEGHTPTGSYRTAMSTAKLILDSPGCDLNSSNMFREYFNKLWMNCDTDSRKISNKRAEFDYPTVAEKFKMIQDDTVSVVVPYTDEPLKIIESIAAKSFVSRYELRRLQRYSVSLYKKEFDLHISRIEKITDGIYLWKGEYSDKCGLVSGVSDPSDLII